MGGKTLPEDMEVAAEARDASRLLAATVPEVAGAPGLKQDGGPGQCWCSADPSCPSISCSSDSLSVPRPQLSVKANKPTAGNGRSERVSSFPQRNYSGPSCCGPSCCYIVVTLL